MLKTLTVQNLVVVRHVDVEFGAGLSVLSGETGAGKSILIEALGLALGERADSKLVRAGDDRATVTAVFDIAKTAAVRAVLQAHALDSDDECVLRRIVLRDGGSRAFCNASPIPVQLLHEIGTLLVDVHAQHASQQLMKREVQRDLLDAYGGHSAARQAVHAACDTWKDAHQRLVALQRASIERDRIELLRYQFEELEVAQVDATEIDQLESEHRRLANGATDLDQFTTLRGLLQDDEDGALPRLRSAATRARALAKRGAPSGNLVEALEQALVCIEESVAELERLESDIEIDPARLARLDDRIAALHALARKHQLTLKELPALRRRLGDELASFDQGATARAELDGQCTAALAVYHTAASNLSKARRGAAKRMNTEITRRMGELGLVHGQFNAMLSPLSEQAPQPHGTDRVEFLVTTNPDQAPGPINKVASGGELSRIGLAIQAATARHAGIPVVVYDEVDTGIGGTTANIVGRTLRDVARECQVICITHSPQVASAGDQHLLVSKTVQGGSTETQIKTLDRNAREREIARMLGAAEATTASVAHARDLIATATGGGGG